jgi:transposase
VLTSFPGVGPLIGARLLAEIGDDRDHFTDARALKAYAAARRSPRHRDREAQAPPQAQAELRVEQRPPRFMTERFPNPTHAVGMT